MGNKKQNSYVFSSSMPEKIQEEELKVSIPEPVKEQPPKKEREVKPITKYTTTRLRVRKAPNGEVLRILELGDSVKVKREKDGWSELVDGTFVMTEFLSK